MAVWQVEGGTERHREAQRGMQRWGVAVTRPDFNLIVGPPHILAHWLNTQWQVSVKSPEEL